jgi:hypothetical protein
MRLFQFVGDRTAEAILKDGFDDLPFQHLTEDGQQIKGVWLFDSPDGWQEELRGVAIGVGKVMLAVEIPEDALSGHEIMMMDDEPEIREFLVPASLVNSFGPPEIADVDLNWPGLLEDIYTDDIGEDPE